MAYRTAATTLARRQVGSRIAISILNFKGMGPHGGRLYEVLSGSAPDFYYARGWPLWSVWAGVPKCGCSRASWRICVADVIDKPPADASQVAAPNYLRQIRSGGSTSAGIPRLTSSGSPARCHACRYGMFSGLARKRREPPLRRPAHYNLAILAPITSRLIGNYISP